MGVRSLAQRATLLDVLLIIAVVALGCGFYLARIGFYTDDWDFLSTMYRAPDQSITGLFRALLTPHVAMRPVQLFYLALLYHAFGLNPLGYHLLNSTVLVVCALLMYTVARGLGAQRSLALAVSLVYSTLPHYTTDRFVVTTFQIPLSVALYGLNVLVSLRVLRAGRYGWMGWLALALLCLVFSGLAYEIVLPLFLLTPPLVWFADRRVGGKDQPPTRVRQAMITVLTMLAVGGVMLYKLRVTVRLGTQPLDEQLAWIARRAIAPTYPEYSYGLNVRQAFRIAYGDYGLSLPRLLAQIFRDYLDDTALLVSVLVGVLVFAALWRASDVDAPRRRGWYWLLLLGIVFFCGGYAIFLTNWSVAFSPTGVANRTVMAAALGVALTFVGLAGWLVSWINVAAVRQGLFGILIAALCAGNLLVTLTIANFWIAAHDEQQRVLAALTRVLPQPPPGKAVLLGGVCVYVGPAPVFEAPWDLSGALQMHYQTPNVRADIISARTAIEGDGLANGIYGVVTRYPYGQFVIYNVQQQELVQLNNEDEARRYFARANGNGSGCPSGVEGHGVAVWSIVRERVQTQQ